jgi:hypothetical protein
MRQLLALELALSLKIRLETPMALLLLVVDRLLFLYGAMARHGILVNLKG